MAQITRQKRQESCRSSWIKDILGANSENRAALVTYGSDIFDGRRVKVVKGFKEDDKYYGLETKFTIRQMIIAIKS